MSQSGRMSLKTLASLAQLLGTKNCSTSRYTSYQFLPLNLKQIIWDCAQRGKKLYSFLTARLRSSPLFSLLLGIAEQSQALFTAIDANTDEKRLLSRLLVKTKKAKTTASDLQRYAASLCCFSCLSN